ncbi:histidine phosphatase family protein [Plesiomonas shigelloides]|uniref:histidine phosphatase family protein n=1 Tax=Plesiomonas shigelloides TaxID=703 RepID=UPI00126287A5|nr:histidine phosphatase family protein [Plesiomonas shigelloides]KAB7711021.1 histidine phosphatase family protein [Plesiomonas shigelloides]
MSRKIFVIRHGETIFNSAQKLQGHCNSDLTLKGRNQAVAVGKKLKKYVDTTTCNIYCSPLGRAVQTADIICSEIGLTHEKLIKDDRVKEFSLGLWEQRTIPSIIKENPNLLDNNDWYLQAPDCESYESVRERLLSWINDLPKDNDIIVVSHGLTGIVLRGILSNLDYESTWKQDLPQDAFFIIEDEKMKRINC